MYILKGNPVSLPKSVQNLKWEPSVNKQYIYDSEEWLNKVNETLTKGLLNLIKMSKYVCISDIN